MAGLTPDSAYQMLMSGRYSDFRITCQSEEFKVHRVIVCAESDFFQKCALGNFSEGKHGVDFPDDNPETIRLMLEWLYCKKFIHPPIPDEAWHEYCEKGCGADYKVKGLTPVDVNFGTATVSDEMVKNANIAYVNLYALADRLGLDKLGEYAALQFLRFRTVVLKKPFLVDIIEEVLRLTSRDDTQLRRTFLVNCLSRLDLMDKNPKAKELLMREEALAYNFATCTNTLKHILKLETTRADTAKVEKDRLNLVLANFSNVVNGVQKCLSCLSMVPQPYLENTWTQIDASQSQPIRYFARCKSAQCGHMMYLDTQSLS